MNNNDQRNNPRYNIDRHSLHSKHYYRMLQEHNKQEESNNHIPRSPVPFFSVPRNVNPPLGAPIGQPIIIPTPGPFFGPVTPIPGRPAYPIMDGPRSPSQSLGGILPTFSATKKSTGQQDKRTNIHEKTNESPDKTVIPPIFPVPPWAPPRPRILLPNQRR